MMKFSDDFVWGTATSSYQIEGAAYDDARGLSVWDMLCRRSGAIVQGDNGDIACDHYNKFKEDVQLMKWLGIKGYRFSISWSRVLPQGIGNINQKGMDFYSKLVDELLANGITPYITLFHWDYPEELYRRGGWLNKDSSEWFAEYTKAITVSLSDRVTNWMTFNEPQCFMNFGHLTGTHAPGDKLPFADVLQGCHNVLLSHGKSFRILRDYSKADANIGYAPVGFVHVPAHETPDQIENARQSMFSVEQNDLMNNTWWVDPILFGRYPEDGLRAYEQYLPKIESGDMAIIKTDLDFLGLNIYHAKYIGTSADNSSRPVGLTAMNWPVVPESLYWGPKFFYERYKKPMMITENGLANADWPSIDGAVHDPQRIDFMNRYLRQLNKAISESIPVTGYFHWSLMDNFEWAEGYTKRFGLIYVDFMNQRRIPKDSAHWYKKLIAAKGQLP